MRKGAHWFTVLVAVGTLALMSLPTGAQAGSTQRYLVLYKSTQVPASAASDISAAGGTLVYSYDAIGVALAESSSASFADSMGASNKVEGVGATGGLGIGVEDVTADGPPATNPDDPVDPTVETFWSRQWDMMQIGVEEAHAVTGGSPTVLVGDLDTGLDFTHPDLAPNYDAANSIDCSSGTPQPLLVGNDANGHGTHTAGTIAAAANGIGIVGVAPNVKIAGIKSANDDGYFFPEMVICGFMWAGDHGVDVTNNSYFADPWLYNCRNDAGQRAIWLAEQRAIRYAQTKGTLVVASAGNENEDLAHPTEDHTSPDWPPGTNVEREVTNACVRIPAEIPGVVTVSATSNRSVKSFYSDYGIGVIDVAAPGGDSIYFDASPDVPNGRVLSTWPLADFCPPARTLFDAGAKYCYAQGTSMAGPHVVGVAALIASRYGPLAPGELAAFVEQSAESLACPDSYPQGTDFPRLDGSPQECQGGTGNNSFYGAGEVNAYNAVTL